MFVFGVQLGWEWPSVVILKPETSLRRQESNDVSCLKLISDLFYISLFSIPLKRNENLSLFKSENDANIITGFPSTREWQPFVILLPESSLRRQGSIFLLPFYNKFITTIIESELKTTKCKCKKNIALKIVETLETI